MDLQKADLLKDQAILEAGETEIREHDQLLKSPFMVELREILIRGFRKRNIDLKARILSYIDETCEKSMQSFYGKLREIVSPEDPVLRESEVEDYIGKILSGENASTGVV